MPISITLTSSGIGSGLSETLAEDVEGIEGLDFERAVAQRPLEGRPDARLDEHVQRVEDQDPAVRAQQASGLDAREVALPLPRPSPTRSIVPNRLR